MNTEQESLESQSENKSKLNDITDQFVEIEKSDIKGIETEIEAPEQEQSTVEDLLEQLEQAKLKAQDNWDKALRIQAEMENLKKRTQKDLENAHKFALENIAKELLTVMDSLELGIQAATGETPELIKLRVGSELTIKQFEKVFSKFNIEAIDPAGKSFNPEFHQAMSMQPSTDMPPNSVMAVFQKGYVMNGRLIRPAMVVVSKAVETTPKDAPKDTPKIDEQA